MKAASMMLAVCLSAGSAMGRQYTVIDLGTLGGPTAGGHAVNDAGHAAGQSTLATANVHGMFAAGATLADIVPLSGDDQCAAWGLDGTDSVIAVSYLLGGLSPRGVLWQNGIEQSLGSFVPRGMSNNGLMAGFVTLADADLGVVQHAASWNAGVVTDLGTLGGSTSFAAAVNGFGQVVGWSSNAGDAAVRAVLWQGGVAQDLGTLGGATSQAYAISNNRGVVGVADTASGAPHGFFLTLDPAGTVTSRVDLGTLAGGYSYAYGLNNSADIVGTSGSRAFLWHAGVMSDLNTQIPAGSGWVLERAHAISDSGFIVGEGLHNGFPRVFLLSRQCYANCDSSTTPPVLNVLDFTCFLNKFAAGDTYANCDGSTQAPVLNVLDFGCFLNRFAAGCP